MKYFLGAMSFMALQLCYGNQPFQQVGLGKIVQSNFSSAQALGAPLCRNDTNRIEMSLQNNSFWGLKELNIFYTDVLIHRKTSTYGCYFFQNFDRRYSEQNLGFTLGKQIYKKLSLGVSTHLQHTTFENKHQFKTFVHSYSRFDFSKSWHLYHQLALENKPNPIHDFLLTNQFNIKTLEWLQEVEIIDNHIFIFKSAIIKTLEKNWDFSIGFNSQQQLGLGLAKTTHQHHYQIQTLYHSTLGQQFQFSYSYQWRKK